MLASRTLRVPVRISSDARPPARDHLGNLRRVLSATERITAACAHRRVQQREPSRGGRRRQSHPTPRRGSSARARRTASRRTAGPGRPSASPRDAAASPEHGITDGDEVIGFVGRFDPDKGIGDLLEAFTWVRARRPRAKLLLVGGGFADDLDRTIAARVRSTPGVIDFGKSHDLAPLYARMDVLAFLPLREGFPERAAEAASAEVPAVGYRSTGVVDAIADGESGTIVARGRRARSATRFRALPLERHASRRPCIVAPACILRSFARERVWKNVGALLPHGAREPDEPLGTKRDEPAGAGSFVVTVGLAYCEVPWFAWSFWAFASSFKERDRSSMSPMRPASLSAVALHALSPRRRTQACRSPSRGRSGDLLRLLEGGDRLLLRAAGLCLELLREDAFVVVGVGAVRIDLLRRIEPA